MLVRPAVAPGVSVAGSNGASGSVSGQVTMKERPGDTTEDLGNVVVYLEPTGATARLRQPSTALVPVNTAITLHARQFQPRVRVVTTGSTVEFPNEDPFSHNVFSKMNGGFDTGVYGRGKQRDNQFVDPGVYPLYCNIHPRMTGFVVTLATPYFTQAASDGRFVIDKVPAGTYRVHVWHDRAAETAPINVVVPSAAAANMRIDLDARGYRYTQHKNKFGQDYTSASGDRY
jgi:plastocyanin